ncbi:hypothetical protein ACJJJB_08100 [Microbulbifer sp. ANSA001]|uniref:pyroglutamyl-peptidase I family protein n=1 Tax=Microbulbifer sp. ANSA001 TaxID=3243358 RepID=UPI00404290CA
MKKVLVTGFEPFGHTPLNPAESVMRVLDGTRIGNSDDLESWFLVTSLSVLT